MVGIIHRKNSWAITSWLALWLITLCFLVFVCFLSSPEKEDSDKCEAVSGDSHIYRGQCLPEGFIPDDLVHLSKRASWLNTTPLISSIAKQPLEDMILDAEKDGMCLVVASGYRSEERQYEIWTRSNFSDYAAPPRGSEHQTGLAVDLQACPMKNGERDDSVERPELVRPFEDLPEYQWLVANAAKYGFEQSFTQFNQMVTGYPPESWHWKFVSH